MKNIEIFRIMDTTYEDNTSWIEYRVNDSFGYEKPQTYTRFVKSSALIAFVKSLKYERKVLLHDALTLVVNAYANLSVARNDAYSVNAPVAGELHGVVAEIVEKLIDGVLVRHDRQILLLAVELDLQPLFLDPLFK